MREIPTRAFSYPITVADADIDELGHVNNVVYLRWVQDAAAAHWDAVATAQVKSIHRWVVLRHEIDYKAPAFGNEQLTAHTWVENYNGARSQRRVLIFRDDTVLAAALTTWCLLDAGTMRPKRVQSDIQQLFLPSD
ncbi:MAG: acyl-CoA thioesterase [Bacteroidia bacterium]|nr:acyl-CoA thioesterase [Bacteroidia bacterium]